ncbi:MAG: protein kinase, partial [Burkholderiaceae bacterium]
MSARLGFPSLAGPAPDAAAPLPIGSQIEAHSVLQVLSEGPNGFVYLTRDATHGATRVLKEFMPRSRLQRLSDGSVRPCDVSDSIATSVARIAFMNEANTLAAFQHPALIRVLGVIPAHRTLYRVMPLVDGVSLEQHCRMRAEPPSLAWLQGVVEGLLQALEVLHERRLGHGSVRPAQVMVRESGQPLLLGFASVARELDAESPTLWQSPGAAPLTRHAPPVPADDLPALAETAYFAATGLQAPTLQQRLEGMPFDLRQALGVLPDGPGDSQQRRRGLLLALEAAFATSTHARPQSAAEFRRLLTGDAPTRGGRYQPTPRWVGEMPERDETAIDLLISQPAPLSDDLPPVPRPVAAAPVVAAVVASVVIPPAAPVVADAEAKLVPGAAWPFEPEPAVEPQEHAGAVARNPVTGPLVDTEAAALAEPLAAIGEAAPPPSHEPALAVAPERWFEPPRRSQVERDFAATEFMVAPADATEALAPFHASAPDTEPFSASLRPQPPRRARSPYAAMAALTVLALVGVGIAGWWYSDADQAGPSGPASAQAPAAGGAP